MIYGKDFPLRALLQALIVLLFQYCQLYAQTTQLNLKKEFPVLKTGNDIWIGTPNGLYQYKSTDDSYKLYTIPGKESDEIHYLYNDGDWLWCIIDSGLAVLQTRMNQWMVYDKVSGLPSNNVRSIAFEGDYVWVATDNGASRFDKLIEEWEWYGPEKGLPALNLVKILVFDKFTWFITEGGFSEYDPQFEKWRHFKIQENQQIKIKEAFEFDNNLWLLTDKGLIKFNPELNSQEYFFNTAIYSDRLVNLLYDEEKIWALSGNKLYYIQSESQVLKEFEGNYYLEGYSLVNFNLDPNEIWATTEKNVLQWNRSDKTWNNIDYASGLSDTVYENVCASGGMTFLVNSKIIDYRLNTGSTWKKYSLITRESIKTTAGQKILKNLFDNEEGGYVAFGKNTLQFSGSRGTYVYNKGFDGRVTSGERLDLKSQLALGKNHMVYGFYNNMDYSENMYGLRYKSSSPDEPLREVNLGDFRRDPGSVPFVENASIFGGNIWVQAGKKTERFKRSLITVKALSGQLRSKKEFEYFQGATTRFDAKIYDISYVKNVFFDIPNLPADLVPKEIEVYLDDKNAANNTENTSAHITIAGVTGDFDRLIETEDYYFHKGFHTLKFNTSIFPHYNLVVRYKVNNQSYEEVLQAQGISSSRKNIYFLNGLFIIPRSFNIEISDTLHTSQQLYELGIDEDRNGIVDPDWIDYENGYLTFPDSYPFPENIYDSMAASIYHIGVQFETQRSVIKLKHKDLVRGTEIVSLDGLTVVQGSDYVLDYTNGTMVFVREGVVTLDTRIEIRYEYYLETQNNRINSVSVNISPSDNFYIQADWVNFSGSDTSSSESNENLVSLHNELRNKIGERIDTRIVTGIAWQADSNRISGASVEGLISTPGLRVQSKYVHYDQSYSNLYEQQSFIGRTKDGLQLFLSSDPLKYLRLTGEWKKEEAFADNSEIIPENKFGNYSILFHHANLPSWQISYQDIRTQSDSGNIRKKFLTNQLEYQVPDRLLQNLRIRSLKIQAYLRNGKQSGQEILGTVNQQFNYKYIRVISNFTDQISGSIYYLRNDYYNEGDSAGNNLLLRKEHVLVNFSQEQWRVLQINLSAENTMDQNPLKNNEYTSLRINNFSQANFRFSPGQIWQKMNPLYFEFNVNHSNTSWGTNNTANSKYLWQFYNDGLTLPDYYQRNSNYSVKNEFRPAANVILYSIFEWNNLELKNGASQLTQYYRRLNEKLELKPGYKLRIILQYKHFSQDRSQARILRYDEPSVWIEHRWNNSFQDIINIQYRTGNQLEINLLTNSSNLILGYNIIWRKEKFIGLKRLEIRNDITENITIARGYLQKKNYLLTNNTSIDIYPLYAAIIRFQFQYRNNSDLLYITNTYDDFAFNFKFILRF